MPIKDSLAIDNIEANKIINSCFLDGTNNTAKEIYQASILAFDSLKRYDIINEGTINKLTTCKKDKYISNNSRRNAIINTYIGHLYTIIGNIDSSAIYYELANDVIEKNDLNDLLFWFEFKKFSFYQTKGSYSNAIINLENLLLNSNSNLSIRQQVRLNNLLGYYYERIGKSNKSVEHFFTANKLAEQVNDAHLAATVLNNIANSYAVSGDLQIAKKYFQQGISIFKKSNTEISVPMLYNNLARLYEQIGYKDSALIFYRKCLGFSSRISKGNLTEVQTNISNLFLSLNHTDSAIFYIEKAINNSKELGLNSREHLHVMQMHSLIEKEKGNTHKAIDILTKAYYSSKQIGLLNEMSVFAKELSLLYSSIKIYDSSFYFLDAHININDSLDIESSKQKLLAKIEENKLDSLKVEAQLLNKEKEYLKLEVSKRNTVVILISCLLCCVLLLIIVVVRSYKRKKLLMEYSLFEKETTIKTKNKELVGAKLEIAAQSEALNELNDKIKSKLSQKYDPEFDELSNLLSKSSNFSNASERRKYINDLIKLDTSFYNKLKEKYPLLTEDELRLSAFIKLNLSSDEIRDIFQISKSSLNTKRYRLRKKLSLSKKNNLDNFLRSY